MLKKNNRLIEQKLNLLFKDLKIFKNDNLIIHSNISGLLQFGNLYDKELLNFFFNYLKKKLGKNSTLIIPVYNYDFPKLKFVNLDLINSHLGIFGNFVLKENKLNRTPNAIFSHLIFGNKKKIFFNSDHNKAFGKETVFELMHKYNFKILNFCCAPDTITFIHHIEEILEVDYRYVKKFEGKIKFRGKEKKLSYNYCVGKKKIDYKLKNNKILRLLNKKDFIQKEFGRFYCYISSTKYLMKSIKNKIALDKNFLIK